MLIRSVLISILGILAIPDILGEVIFQIRGAQEEYISCYNPLLGVHALILFMRYSAHT